VSWKLGSKALLEEAERSPADIEGVARWLGVAGVKEREGHNKERAKVWVSQTSKYFIF